MNNLMSVLGTAAHAVHDPIENTCSAVKKGILWLGEKGSRWMFYLYSGEGLVNYSKAAISWMRLFPFVIGYVAKYIPSIASIQNIFENMLKTTEGQKDVYYAAQIFNSGEKLIKTTIDPDTGEITNRNFVIPGILARDTDGNLVMKWDLKELPHSIKFVGDIFEVGMFSKKYAGFQYPRFTTIANNLGNFQLFSYHGEAWVWNDIWVINVLTVKPKDFCIFIASAIEIYNTKILSFNPIETFSQWRELGWEDRLKVVNCTGKMLLIWRGPYDNGMAYLAVADVITQNAALIRFCLRSEREREHRFAHPGVAPTK